MVGMMGTGPREGPKIVLSVGALFIFYKPGTRAKAAYRTKRGPSQNFRTLSLPFSDPFSPGMGSLVLLVALKHELGPLRSGMGPQVCQIVFIFYFYVFSCS